MPLTENWWNGAVDWTTPAGGLLKGFLASLPRDRHYQFTIYGSAALHLFRPSFEEESPNRFLENTERLWRTFFGAEIDVRTQIIAPALARRRQGYGHSTADYKSRLGQ